MNELIQRALDRLHRYLHAHYLQRQEALAQRRHREYVYERPFEYSFALTQLMHAQARSILDVGTGSGPFAALLRQCGFGVTASDSKGSYWSSFHNSHIWVHTNDITQPVIQGPFDAVLAISAIEHIEQADLAVSEMCRLVKPDGGLLVLSFPYSHDTHVDNVYNLLEADELSKSFRYSAQSFSEADLDRWKTHLSLLEQDRAYIRGWTGKFWRTGERIAYPQLTKNQGEANCLCVSLRRISL